MNDMLNTVTEAVSNGINQYMEGSARTKQSRAGILGPSDIGFCRQKAVLVTRETKPTDTVPTWAASVGTAIHNYVEAAIHEAHPEWLFGSIDHVKIHAELPSGVVLQGTPDIVAVPLNAVLDIKTVNGYEWTKRKGPSQAHKYQRHLYALGLMQAEILDPTQDVYVGNVYLDRSGADPNPMVFIEQFDPDLTKEIDTWVGDVIYAVQNGEDSARDIPAAVCDRICEFFTVCRGGLEDNNSEGPITDPKLLDTINMYVEGRDLEKQGKQMKAQAAAELEGVSGTTETHQVRWVQVQPNNTARLDIIKKRK